jgi:hypothetical protein
VKPSYQLYPRPTGLAGYLERLPQLRNALGEARNAARSEIALVDCLPARLARFAQSVHSTGSRLVITVTSAEAAHLARLLIPEVERTLSRKGLKFNEILVNVQTKSVVQALYRPRPKDDVVTRLLGSAENTKSEHLQTSMKKLAETLRQR